MGRRVLIPCMVTPERVNDRKTGFPMWFSRGATTVLNHGMFESFIRTRAVRRMRPLPRMSTRTWSAHWLKHPSFADAVEKFLEREAGGIDDYIDELNDRSPFKR